MSATPPATPSPAPTPASPATPSPTTPPAPPPPAPTPATTTPGADPAWHTLTVDDVLARQGVAADTGLAAVDAVSRLARYGPEQVHRG